MPTNHIIIFSIFNVFPIKIKHYHMTWNNQISILILHLFPIQNTNKLVYNYLYPIKKYYNPLYIYYYINKTIACNHNHLYSLLYLKALNSLTPLKKFIFMIYK